MSGFSLFLIVATQFCLVGGHILLKHAMELTNAEKPDWKKFSILMPLGIFVYSLWFFLWLGLMRDFDLSFLYPFEGLSPLLLAVGASLFLKEKITLRLVLGILVMTAGLLLVLQSN